MEPKKHMGGALDKVPGNGHVVGLHERHGTGSIGAWAEWFATAPGRPPWESERPAVKRAKEDSTVPKEGGRIRALRAFSLLTGTFRGHEQGTNGRGTTLTMPPELPNPVRIPWPRSPRREGRNQIVDAYVDARLGIGRHSWPRSTFLSTISRSRRARSGARRSHEAWCALLNLRAASPAGHRASHRFLSVSVGQGEVPVADVTGQTEADARSQLEGFKVEVTPLVVNEPSDDGVVLGQTPASETLAAPGATVTLTVGTLGSTP